MEAPESIYSKLWHNTVYLPNPAPDKRRRRQQWRATALLCEKRGKKEKALKGSYCVSGTEVSPHPRENAPFTDELENVGLYITDTLPGEIPRVKSFAAGAFFLRNQLAHFVTVSCLQAGFSQAGLFLNSNKFPFKPKPNLHLLGKGEKRTWTVDTQPEPFRMWKESSLYHEIQCIGAAQWRCKMRSKNLPH